MNTKLFKRHRQTHDATLNYFIIWHLCDCVIYRWCFIRLHISNLNTGVFILHSEGINLIFFFFQNYVFSQQCFLLLFWELMLSNWYRVSQHFTQSPGGVFCLAFTHFRLPITSQVLFLDLINSKKNVEKNVSLENLVPPPPTPNPPIPNTHTHTTHMWNQY